jgi:hypothetical protein
LRGAAVRGTPVEHLGEERRMKKIVYSLLLASALVFVGSALAGVETYAGPRYWYPGEGGGSSYRASWYRNAFNKATSGYDTTVTFIDNTSYGWHQTVRNTDMVTYTLWFSSQVKRGHCRANRGYHWGGCYVFD